MASEKIRATFVFEIIGKPPKHIKNTLEQFINKIGEIKVIEIINKKIHEPKKVKKVNVKGVYTTFAEVEILGENIEIITDIVLHMLPSHVEIIEPFDLKMKNFELSSFLSKLAMKIHRYDEIAKASLIERNILIKKLKEAKDKLEELGFKEEDSKKKEEKKSEKRKTKKKIKKEK